MSSSHFMFVSVVNLKCITGHFNLVSACGYPDVKVLITPVGQTNTQIE